MCLSLLGGDQTHAAPRAMIALAGLTPIVFSAAAELETTRQSLPSYLSHFHLPAQGKSSNKIGLVVEALPGSSFPQL